MTTSRLTVCATIVVCFAVLLTPRAVFAQNASQPSSVAPVAAPARPAIVKSPPPANFQWSGFYLGANVGYGGGDAKTTFDFPDFTGGFNPDTLNAEPMGWTWGFQGGMNFRMSTFIAGVEADYTISDITGTTSVSPFKFENQTINGALVVDDSLNWFSTFRGRFGVATSRMLYFGTAGLALGSIDHFSSVSEGPDVAPLSSEGTKLGWTFGAGVEGAINSHMTWRAQYLFIKFGDTSESDDVAEIRHTWNSRYNTFSGGVNFRF